MDTNLARAVDQVRVFLRDRAKTPVVKAFFDEPTFTATYVAYDPATREAAIIDSVLDFDQPSGRAAFGSADAIIKYIRKERLTVQWLLETHAHADHLSAALYTQAEARRHAGHRRRNWRRSRPSWAERPKSSTRAPSSRVTARNSTGSLPMAIALRSARFPSSRCTSRDTHQRTWRTSRAMRYSSAIRCSCPTTAPRGRTFPAATPGGFINRFDG